MSKNGWTMKKATTGAYGRCSRCHESIRAGEFYERRGPEYRHADPCSAPVAAPVAPAPVAVSTPAARPVVAGYRTFGALAVDSSFSAWEREYDQEG